VVIEELVSICHGIPGVRWESSEKFHITLQFLGELEEEVIENISETLESISLPKFEISFAGVGFFHATKGGYTIWAAPKANSNLNNLHEQICKILNNYIFRNSFKEYIPHLTLGKTSNWNYSRWEYYFETFQNFQSKAFFVNEFYLFRSELKSTGSIYYLEKTFSFSK
jgi:2'-5' RNA ligase